MVEPPMPQTATIKRLPAAFRMMKSMQAECVEWGEDYRQGARDAVAALLRGRTDQLIDEHLERMAELGQADRRNGCYRKSSGGSLDEAHGLAEAGTPQNPYGMQRTRLGLAPERGAAARAVGGDSDRPGRAGP